MVKRVKNRSEYTYRCRVCGFENFHTRLPEVAPGGLEAATGVPVTILGDYGTNATPTPTSNTISVYVAITVSFTAESGDDPAYLSDSLSRFVDKNIKPEWSISIETESGTNDGSYTIASMGVSRGVILLSSTDSLTTESAATAGQVTINKVSYKPNVTTGCPFCGSLNSK